MGLNPEFVSTFDIFRPLRMMTHVKCGVITICSQPLVCIHSLCLRLTMSACPNDQAFFCELECTEEQLPARHMLVNYADCQEDEDIHDEDVIRVGQGFFCTEQEIAAFRRKSNDRCPTYGNCNKCWSSGPVGKMCTFCADPPDCNIGCQVVFMIDTAERTPRKILDAERVSDAYGANHKIAKGRSTHRWLRTPTQTIEAEDVTPKLDQAVDRELRRLAEQVNQHQPEEEGFQRSSVVQQECVGQMRF